MRAFMALIAAGAVALLAQTGPAPAKDCIKGAIVGGIAGYAGHHGLAAAAAGCVAARHLPKSRKGAYTSGQAPAHPEPIDEQDRTSPREDMTSPN